MVALVSDEQSYCPRRGGGVIAHAPPGSGGFGYDPLFFVPELGQTFAEIPAEVKNTLSHRRALPRCGQAVGPMKTRW